MLVSYVVGGAILILIGLAFVDNGIGGKTIAKLIPIGLLGKLFKQIVISFPTGAFLIIVGAWFLSMGL